MDNNPADYCQNYLVIFGVKISCSWFAVLHTVGVVRYNWKL